MVDQRTVFSFIKVFIRKHVIHDAGSEKSEVVCQDTVNVDTGNGHTVLVTVLLCGTHIRKFQMVTRKFAQCPDISRWDKGRFYHSTHI